MIDSKLMNEIREAAAKGKTSLHEEKVCSRQPAAPIAQDAVDALEIACEKYLFGRAAGKEISNDSKVMASILMENISHKGYTLRRETMTEAELERDAVELAISSRFNGVTIGMIKTMIIELAKKYRG